MAYFRTTSIGSIHHDEWDALVRHITDAKNWPDDLTSDCSHKIPREVSHHLEAKALYVFTMARRLIRAALELGEGPSTSRWRRYFVEATSLLFPMIELVGHARLDHGGAARHYGTNLSTANLWTGLRWLRDPHELTQVTNNQLKYDSKMVSQWQIGHLIALRNYYLHGSKSAKDRHGNPIPVEDIMSYRLPSAMIELAEKGIPVYWRDLREDDGNQ